MSASDLEAILKLQIRALKLPPPLVEHKFGGSLGRKWRFDLAWPSGNLAVEISGGTWMPKSHHTHGQGYEDDCEKGAAAIILGWRVLTLTGKQVQDGTGASWIRQALLGGEIPPEMFSRRGPASKLSMRGMAAKAKGKLQTLNLQQFKGVQHRGPRELPERVKKGLGLA